MNRVARFLAVALAFLCTCAAGSAQTTVTPSGMGATSPLDAMGASGASGSIGPRVPLGTTEIDPRGLSPLPSSTCNATASTGGTSSTSSASSTFDGGGMTSANSSCATSGSGTSPAQSSTSSPGVIGSAIPLGATETGTNGVSPILAVPPPSTSGTAYGTTMRGTTMPCASGFSATSVIGGAGTGNLSSSSGC